VMDSVVQENMNPIEKVLRSTLIMATTIQGQPVQALIKVSMGSEGGVGGGVECVCGGGGVIPCMVLICLLVVHTDLAHRSSTLFTPHFCTTYDIHLYTLTRRYIHLLHLPLNS
jgi:hypothetical protein